MKKRNKEYLKEKDFLRLQRESAENWKAQRNLGWVELDEPIHDGFIAKLVLRKDVSNREDAWIFQGIIDNFGTSCYAKRIKDYNFTCSITTTRVKNKYNPFSIYHNPHIREISETNYEKLSAQVRKYFRKVTSISSWKGDYYYCTVPSFYYDISIEKRWVTKVMIYDEILQQESAEIDAEIDRNHYSRKRTYHHYSAPKRFRKGLNRSQRAKAKTTLYNIVFNEKDVEFEDNFKGANWLWW